MEGKIKVIPDQATTATVETHGNNAKGLRNKTISKLPLFQS
jgi:hypothetical protein